MRAFMVSISVQAALIAGPVAAQTADSARATPAAIDAGRDVFHGPGNCAMCHGANLEGSAMAPALATGKFKDAAGGTFDAIAGIITNGVPNTAMPSRSGGISDAQLQEVAAYIWAVSHRKAKP
jgi:mono/diheme cytochrome c family protein